MSQVIMWFLFPIGLYFYVRYERKSMPRYQKIFDDYQHTIENNTLLEDEEKLKLYEEMLVNNDYKIVEKTNNSLEGEKNIFYMSLFVMGLGLFIVGAIIYLLYFYYIQKPHEVIFYTKKKD